MNPSNSSDIRFAGQRSDNETTVTMIVDGTPRELPLHLGVYRHSPSGFEWGYLGSGPAQLALALCVEMAGPERALRVHQAVKDRLVAPLDGDDWVLTGRQVLQVIDAQERARVDLAEGGNG
jgi:hypothetical protein